MLGNDLELEDPSVLFLGVMRPEADKQTARGSCVHLADQPLSEGVGGCEEIVVGRIRQAARLGAPGPNQAKAFTRCGMGPCQGRICGSIVSAVMADTLDKPIAAVGTYRPRAPYKPVTLGALAGLSET